MKKILCPTDFSDTAHSGVAYAAKFCQATDAGLTLFHVQSLFALSPLEVVGAKALSVEGIAEELEQQCQEVERVFKIPCEAQMQTSVNLLSKVIEKTASGYDLIIMGTAGRHDLYSFFAGSNTYNAIRNTNIPVLFIPHHYVYAPIQKIVYAFNYLEEAKLPMSQLSPWVKKLRASLEILEVMEAAISMDLDEDLRDMQELVHLQYRDLPMKFYSLRSADKYVSIHNHVIDGNADLLVLCTKHRGLLGSLFHKSVIKSISRIATYPVMVVHE